MSAHTVDEYLAEEIDYIGPGEPASHAKRRMDTNEIRSILVVDNERPIGLIQRNALINVDPHDLEKPVSEFMRTEFPRVMQGESIEQANQHVEQDINIEQIPVISESGELVGVIDRHHLMTSAEATGGTTSNDTANVANRMPVNEGMTVKDASGSKLGTIAGAEFKTDGGVEFFIVEHRMIFKHQKKLPGDLISQADGEEVHLKIDSTEFGMMRNIDEEE